MIEAVDLFCGAGGLSNGLKRSGVKVTAGYDIEERCRFAFEHNNQAKFLNKDVSEVSVSELKEHYSTGIKLLAGCAPCQPFSTYTQAKSAQADKKWPLLYQFARLIDGLRPELVTMENVPTVTRHNVYDDFINELRSNGYSVWAGTVYCPDYGIPQLRRRHVVLASLLGEIQLIQPTHQDRPATVWDTISNLPRLAAGEVCESDRLHRASSLSSLNLKRIRASKPGGTWRDWPEEIVATCHKKASGKTYPGVYGRMTWGDPSPTITTQCHGFGNGRFGHPEQDRAISLREAALLQTFPTNYEFTRPDMDPEFGPVAKMIGNAVPVRLGEVVGLSLQNHLETIAT